MNPAHIVLIDNHDSFVYNLVDALRGGGHRCTVFRNTIAPEEVFAARPDLIVLSPGPGHPRQAGAMMEVLAQALDQQIPVLGICLGFQAILEHFGGSVVPCGPVHGTTDVMRLTEAAATSEIFHGLTIDAEPDHPEDPGHAVPVARYHSLGCTTVPDGMEALGWSSSRIGEVVMAARCVEQPAIGLQFHPESVLSPSGPILLDRLIAHLLESRKD
ncbi:anthranilate synthase component II [Corynebacterium lowii]|uniref:anthranilate synthase n=1 Tax=Corynebacterium lowii TaxID=1544413 RepID=A0A0Q0ZAP8_9CORY|nr:anthranilate synthase component II [Corynebacterium lowii]KQB87008.1 Anthranilate synthase component 2 [Corynebacterium lowii]MDP9852411.1 anthranilate synthase component 2 [Corynebacterium lowii]